MREHTDPSRPELHTLDFCYVLCVLWARCRGVPGSCESLSWVLGSRCRSSGRAEGLLLPWLAMAPARSAVLTRLWSGVAVTYAHSSFSLFQAGVKGTLGRLVGIFEVSVLTPLF